MQGLSACCNAGAECVLQCNKCWSEVCIVQIIVYKVSWILLYMLGGAVWVGSCLAHFVIFDVLLGFVFKRAKRAIVTKRLAN
jgi:hypothetical protein